MAKNLEESAPQPRPAFFLQLSVFKFQRLTPFSCIANRTPLLHFKFMFFSLVCYDRELQEFFATPLPSLCQSILIATPYQGNAVAL